MNTDDPDKKVHIGGVFSTYTKEKKFFYSIVLVLKVLKSLLLTMTETFLIKYYSELKNSKKKTIKSC